MLGVGLVGRTGEEAGPQGPEISQMKDYYKVTMKREDLQKLVRGIVKGSLEGHCPVKCKEADERWGGCSPTDIGPTGLNELQGTEKIN